jgi:DNA-binding SARP family transcriptional activator
LRVQTRAGKALLAILLEARLEGRGEVPDLELVDRLFSAQSDRRARDGLKNLVYRLRTAMGAGAITRTPTGYALGAIMSDAERFLESGDPKLWRGAYLEDLSELGARGETRNTLLTALRIATETQLEANSALAVRAARALVAMEPYDEDALRLLLRALRASNNRRDLVRAYESAREKFSEVEAALPDSWQTFLAAGVTA